MKIPSVVLFGSRARKDNDDRSDIDILLITDDEHPRQVKIDSVSLSFYPLDILLEKAKNGDLFVLHIILEGKPLLGSSEQFSKIKQSFIKKLDYSAEIHSASDLGWMLVRYVSEFDEKIVRRRVTWCVRTILIAISVQNNQPTFSTNGLRALEPSPAVARLLRQKDEPVTDDTSRLLRSFLVDHGLEDPCPDADDVSEYEAYFNSTENSVAMHMFASKYRKEESDEYAGA